MSLLEAIALRAEAGRRVYGDSARAVLRSIVDATVTLFDAEAASIALYDAASDRLVFEVASGEQGQGVIGLSIAPDQGIAGYVFRTGQALALSDVARDARFGRAVAEQTAYVPRSIVAVPLVSDDRTIGVLEVLDKRSAATFSLRDIELAAVFAGQAATAIGATRVERDVGSLLESSLRALAGADVPERATLDEIVAAATTDLGRDDSSRLWPLADVIARLRTADPDQLELVTDILDALHRRATRDSRRRRRSRPDGGDTSDSR
ncbi:MAG TPA: GAF domain-containing protein [Candidatus Limnocylindrales bacterium]|nr:GAF domain-containing protein [Candidatus Limnocylindrales bacterium]